MSRARAGRVDPPLSPTPDADREPPALVARVLAGRIWPVLQSLVGAGILVALVARLGAAPFIDGLRAVGGRPVLAALGIGVATTVLSAWRWCLVARSLRLRLSLGRAVAECYRALFLNSVLPAGVLGDVNRAVGHGRRAGDLGRGVRAVVIERMAGQGVLVVFAAAVLVVQPRVLTGIHQRIPASATAVLGPVCVVLAAIAIATAIATAVVVTVRKRAGRTASAGTHRAARLRVGLWTAVAALSAAALLGYLTMFVIAARAAGSQVAVTDLLPVLVLALLAMGLPLSIGGWGPREAVTTAAFAAVGLSAAQGLTVAVVYGALSFVACLPGAAVLLLSLARPALRSDAQRPPEATRPAEGVATEGGVSTGGGVTTC